MSYPCAVLVFRHQIYFKIASELSYIHWEGAAVLYEISYVLELLGLPEKMTELNLCLNVFDATPPICPTENVDVSKSFWQCVRKTFVKNYPLLRKGLERMKPNLVMWNYIRQSSFCLCLHYRSYREKYSDPHQNYDRYRFDIMKA